VGSAARVMFARVACGAIKVVGVARGMARVEDIRFVHGTFRGGGITQPKSAKQEKMLL
jgi:hypothetical protein